MIPLFLTCRKCGDTIYSKWSGHFVSCKCKSCMIDQTEYYARQLGDPKDYYTTTITTILIEEWWDKHYGVEWRNGTVTPNELTNSLNYPYPMLIKDGKLIRNGDSAYIHQFMLQVTDKNMIPYYVNDNFYVYLTVELRTDLTDDIDEPTKPYAIRVAGVDDCSFTKYVTTEAEVNDELSVLKLFSNVHIGKDKEWLFTN